MPKRNVKQVSKWTVFQRLEALGIKKGELAEALDVSPQTVNSRFKNGWSIEALHLLCEVLGLDESELVNE